jgi:predicted nuclease of restriction endonuclease-like RecB superfamily
VTRVSKGYVWPAYAKSNEANLDLAAALARIYEKGLGRRWEEVSEDVKEYEEIGFDYRFVRGLAALLERRCLFEAKAGVDPRTVRRLAFQEANKFPVVDEDARVQIMSKVAEELAVPVE